MAKRSLLSRCPSYLRIITRNDLNWADRVNYTLRKAWKALLFILHILKKGNNNMKRVAYTALVRPIVGMERCVGTVQRREGKRFKSGAK